MLTAVLGISTAIGYLAVWIFYAERDDNVSMPQIVYMNFGFLLWFAVATTALCFVLARRAARVTALMDVRQRLVSEAAEADDRHTRELAEHLHDGPLQILLAARLELDDVRERHPDPALDVLQTALHEAAARLRSTVSELHPQVLAQLGLTPAIQELVRQYESRGDCVIEAQLEDVGRPSSQSLLYRAARELLANIHKHAHATGFDPAIVDRCVAEGHIGLASLLVRVDAMGGSMDIRSEVGFGTQVTVTSPPEIN